MIVDTVQYRKMIYFYIFYMFWSPTFSWYEVHDRTLFPLGQLFSQGGLNQKIFIPWDGNLPHTIKSRYTVYKANQIILPPWNNLQNISPAMKGKKKKQS